VLTPWIAPVVLLAVSALVGIAAVIATPRNYGATLRSLLRDAEALFRTRADDGDAALRWLIVEDLADALDANARHLRFKGFLVNGAIALLLFERPADPRRQSLNREYTGLMAATSSPADAEQVTTDSTQAPALPPLEPMRIPSGPAFPEFVYRFFDKLFRLDRPH